MSSPLLISQKSSVQTLCQTREINCYKHLFFIRIVKFRNELPGKVAEADNIQQFKSKLNLHLNRSLF